MTRSSSARVCAPSLLYGLALAGLALAPAAFALDATDPARGGARSQPRTIFVDAGSPCVSCDGTSWATAFPDLSAGYSAGSAGASDTLRVAEGTYRGGFTPRPLAGMHVFGGYPHGGGPRDPARHPTIIGPDDGLPEGILHLYAPEIVVDGFTLTGCTADVAIDVAADRDTLRNLTIVGSAASFAVLYVSLQARDVAIERCVFRGNSCGGAYGIVGADHQAAPMFTDCLFAGNTVTNGVMDAGIVHAGDGGRIVLRNSVVWGNTLARGPALTGTGAIDAMYCDIAGGWPGVGNIDTDPEFCEGAGGAPSLHASSPLWGAGAGGTTIGGFVTPGCGIDFHDGGPAWWPGGAVAPLSTGLLGIEGPATNASRMIGFALAQQGTVRMQILDARGTRVATLAAGAFSAGPHRVTWSGMRDDGHAAASGVYEILFEAGAVTQTRRLLRVR